MTSVGLIVDWHESHVATQNVFVLGATVDDPCKPPLRLAACLLPRSSSDSSCAFVMATSAPCRNIYGINARGAPAQSRYGNSTRAAILHVDIGYGNLIIAGRTWLTERAAKAMSPPFHDRRRHRCGKIHA